MSHRRSVVLWFGIVTTSLAIYWGALILVDPLGIWGAPIIPGFNNYKVGQPLTLDLWKPYQYRMVKPDVVFLGSSRVYVGLAPKDYPDRSARVYNMGMSSLSLKDALAYVQFMITTHKPRKIYLGLDLFQFGTESAEGVRAGFSQHRLGRISGSWLSSLLFKLEETSGTGALASKTVEESRKKTGTLLFEGGWDVQRGSAREWNRDAWVLYLKNFMKTYETFSLSEESFVDLEAILSLCHEERIEVELFFNPLTDDLLALIWLTGRYSALEEVKRRTGSLHPFRDFAVMSELSVNMGNFHDASHYTGTTGARFVLMKEGNSSYGPVRAATVEDWLDSSRSLLRKSLEQGAFALLREGVEVYRAGDGKSVDRLVREYMESRERAAGESREIVTD